MSIETVGKGAVPDSPDRRDFQASLVMGAPVIAWNTPFFLPIPPQSDQNGSSSCVAHAWSYYHWQLKNKDFSKRDLYAPIHLPQGGAYIRDGGLRLVNNGQATLDETVDPIPQTETAMRDMTGITAQAGESDKELNSFIVNYDIDSVAAAIQQYNGVVFGVVGSNAGWKTSLVRPPLAGETTWGHALYLFGYHLHDNLKCVVARSSWSFTPEHHIREDYFADEGLNVFNPWTLITQPNQSMDFINNHQNYLVQNSDTGAFGLVKGDSLLVCTPDRAGLLALTLFQRKATESISIPATLWDNLPHKMF